MDGWIEIERLKGVSEWCVGDAWFESVRVGNKERGRGRGRGVMSSPESVRCFRADWIRCGDST
jgi:hypothetical protein